MERLTIRKSDFTFPRRGSDAVSVLQCVNRLATIEDIWGDDYDLDRMRELVEADRDGRCFILPPDDFPWTIRGDVMRDLVRCNCRAYKKIHEIIQKTQVKGEQDG